MTDNNQQNRKNVPDTMASSDKGERNSEKSFVQINHLDSALHFVAPLASKRRITSQDWVNARSLNEMPPLPRDFSFNDTIGEDDPDTSALQSFSESQGSFYDSCTDSELTHSWSGSAISSQVLAIHEKKFCSPTDLDVLLGRGGGTNNHPGNIRYRDEVEKVKPMYFSCNTKNEKKEVSELLVAYVEDYGGRFLIKDKETNQWILATAKQARKKASQALRETKWKTSKEKNDDVPD